MRRPRAWRPLAGERAVGERLAIHIHDLAVAVHRVVLADDVIAAVAALHVGLTPYAVTDFNRASFPLKTLEYLAAGRPAVSTDLPAARALETDLVELVTTPQEFASRTLALLSAPPDEALVARRQAFARQHSWAERARRLEQIVALAGSGPGTEREGDR